MPTSTKEGEDFLSCWLDDAGDMLEREGYPPGRIFEFHEHIRGGDRGADHDGEIKAGGVVVTRFPLPEGKPPRGPLDIDFVVLARVDSRPAYMRLGPMNPLVVTSFLRLNFV